MLEADINMIKIFYAIMWQQWEENHGQKITIFFERKMKILKIKKKNWTTIYVH